MKKPTAKKPIIPKVKKVVPIVAADPDKGVATFITVPIKEKTWFERWFRLLECQA